MTIEVKINLEYQKLLPKLPQEEYEALKESVKTEGQHYPITVNKEGIILDGHHRFQICEELELTPKYEVKQFPSVLHEKKFVIESNLLRRQLTTFQRFEMSLPLLEIERGLAKERMLLGKEDPTLNLEEGEAVEKVAPLAGISPALYYQCLWLEKNALKEELEGLRSSEKAISNLYKETKRYLTKIEETKEESYGIPEIDKITTSIQRGGIYALGNHRLMCGDATNEQNVGALMNGKKADMLFTDPPYNEGYGYRFSDFKDVSETYWQDLTTAFSLINKHLSKHASLYVKHSSRQIPLMIDFLEQFYQIRNVIIWISNSQAHPQKNYDSYYEPIYFCTFGDDYIFNKEAELRERPKDYWSGEGKEFVGLLVNVWYDIQKDQAGCLTPEIPTIKHQKIHPCSMPTRLPERAIKVSTNEENIVLDLFGGSGSTLMACEQTGRHCYMMEIDPRYCQIIIDRWEAYSGKKAIKLTEGD